MNASEATPLTRERALELLGRMVLARRFEDTCAQLYSEGKIHGFLHLYTGQEAVAVGAMQQLRSDDGVVATYREHIHAMLKGVPMGSIMAEMFGKQEGCSGGRGGSMHLFDHRRAFYGGYAIVAGGLPLAVGIALADRMQKRDRVTACFFGEGAVAEGEFHEAMNLASLWKLPVVFLCENNRYAMGTALERSESQIDLHLKAQSYGIPSVSVDGMDVLAVETVAGEAITAARRGDGPSFLEFRTYRFRAHSMFDPQRYRSREEVNRWLENDPIVRFTNRLKAEKLAGDADLKQIERNAVADITGAVEFAETGTWEPIESLTRHVYAQEAG